MRRLLLGAAILSFASVASAAHSAKAEVNHLASVAARDAREVVAQDKWTAARAARTLSWDSKTHSVLAEQHHSAALVVSMEKHSVTMAAEDSRDATSAAKWNSVSVVSTPAGGILITNSVSGK
jgi:hypothetical protein